MMLRRELLLLLLLTCPGTASACSLGGGVPSVLYAEINSCITYQTALNSITPLSLGGVLTDLANGMVYPGAIWGQYPTDTNPLVTNYLPELIQQGLSPNYTYTPARISLATLLGIVGGGVLYSTHASLLAVTTPSTLTTIAQAGFYAPGDGGWAVYDWNATSAATADGITVVLPSGQSSSIPGRYLIRTLPEIPVQIFGAKCDGVTNDSTPINAAVTYAFTLPNSPVYPTITLEGASCAIASPIEITGNGLNFGNGGGNLSALAGSWNRGSWPPTDPYTGAPPVGMIDINSTSSNINISTNLVGNGVANVAGITNNAQDHLAKVKFTGSISGFSSYGIWIGPGTSLKGNNCNISQNSNVSSRIGYGIYSAGSGDSLFVGCLVYYALIPVFVDSATNDFAFRVGHIFNGASAAQGGTSAWNPINVEANGDTSLVGNTIDNGAIFVTSGASALPHLVLTDNYFEYGSAAAWSMPAWVRFYTTYTASGGASGAFGQGGLVRISNNIFPNVSGGVNMTLEGSGTWAAPAQNAQAAINRGGDTFFGGLALGNGVVQNSLRPQAGLTTSPYTLDGDTDCPTDFVISNGGTSVTITFPNNLSVGCHVSFFAKGSGTVTLSATSPAVINNAATYALTQYVPVECWVARNIGGSSDEYACH